MTVAAINRRYCFLSASRCYCQSSINLNLLSYSIITTLYCASFGANRSTMLLAQYVPGENRKECAALDARNCGSISKQHELMLITCQIVKIPQLPVQGIARLPPRAELITHHAIIKQLICQAFCVTICVIYYIFEEIEELCLCLLQKRATIKRIIVRKIKNGRNNNEQRSRTP